MSDPPAWLMQFEQLAGVLDSTGRVAAQHDGPRRADPGEQPGGGDEQRPEPEHVERPEGDVQQAEDGHDERGNKADESDHAGHLPVRVLDVTSAALGLADELIELEQAAEAAASAPDGFVELARVLRAVEAAVDRLGHLGDYVRGELHERMPYPRARTEVGVLVKSTVGGSTVWDGSKVWPEVYRKARARADRGFEPVDAAISAAREAAEPQWRASVLAGWGVEVDECRSVTPPRPTVKFI